MTAAELRRQAKRLRGQADWLDAKADIFDRNERRASARRAGFKDPSDVEGSRRWVRSVVRSSLAYPR